MARVAVERRKNIYLEYLYLSCGEDALDWAGLKVSKVSRTRTRILAFNSLRSAYISQGEQSAKIHNHSRMALSILASSLPWILRRS